MKAKEKNSNIELLRIICMIFIIAHHYVMHTNGFVVSRFNFNTDIFYLKAIAMFGKASCSIFALITGYYMINSKVDWKKLKKKIISLFLFCTIYSVIIYASFVICGKINISPKGIFNAILPLLYDENWFVKDYILLLLVVPFLNMVLKSIDKRMHRKIIFIMILVWSFLPSILNASLSFSNIDFFIIMYVIGAYESMYPNKNENKWNDLFVVIVLMFIIVFSILFNYFMGITLNNDYLITCSGRFMEYNNIFSVLWAIYMFKFFIKINFRNLVINYIGGTILVVYVIHDNSYVRKWIWNEIFPNKEYINNPYLHSILKICVVFFICVIIELIRKYIIINGVKNT